MNKLNSKNLTANILLFLASTLFSLLMVVLVMEVRYFIKMQKYVSYTWHDPNTRFDSELGWSPISNTRVSFPEWGTLSSNSQGFRSPEIDQNKKQIIILGDSVAWGFGVSDTETFPYLLNEKVANMNYQVSNLAVSGYDLGQYYLFLKRHINKFNNLKQVVLVICTQNDLICTGKNFDSGKRKPLFIARNGELILTSGKINKYCLRNLFSRSYFLGNYLPNVGIIGKFLSWVSGDRILSGNEELKEVSIGLLQKIYELVLSHNAKLLIILSPSRDDFKNKSASLNAFEHIFNNSKPGGFGYIDYFEILKKVDKEELHNLYLDDGHYTKKGNALLAETAYKHLIKDNLLN